jgi:hypothetical protein
MFWILLWSLQDINALPVHETPQVPVEKLDSIELLSTRLKVLSKTLSGLLKVKDEETIAMLEIESSMMELQNLVMQLEEQISTLPPSP